MLILGLGNGLPNTVCKIERGDVVIDLDTDAGNDASIARHEVEEIG